MRLDTRVVARERVLICASALLVSIVVGIASAAGVRVPDDGKIAFDASFVLYVMNADGSGLGRLTPDSWTVGEPVWSPNGTKLAFIRGAVDPDEGVNPVAELYVVAADGSGLRRLTRDRFQDFSPTWSADSRTIAFVSHRGGGNPLMTVSANGGRIKRLATGGYYDEPDWSPDGRQLAVSLHAGADQTDIYVVNSDGSGLTQLTEADEEADTSPTWSPNGRRIAFVRTPSLSDNSLPMDDIYVMNADGRRQVRLTRIDANYPAWSPNGRWIAFLSYGRKGYSMYRMNADGGGLRGLAGGDVGEPSWSPDGTKIAFERVGDIYVMDADGTRKRRIFRSSSGAYDPAWQPTP